VSIEMMFQSLGFAVAVLVLLVAIQSFEGPSKAPVSGSRANERIVMKKRPVAAS